MGRKGYDTNKKRDRRMKKTADGPERKTYFWRVVKALNQFLDASSHGFVGIWVDDEDAQRSGAWMLCHCRGWDRELSSGDCERRKPAKLNLYMKPLNRIANSEVGIRVSYTGTPTEHK